MHRKEDQPLQRFPLSRRKFVGGLGSIAIVAAAASGVDAQVHDGSQPCDEGQIEDRELSEFAEKTISAGVRFTDVFAPAENLVKAVEQPYRQDICLNGAWEFQPVSLLCDFRTGQDYTPILPPVEATAPFESVQSDHQGW